MSALTPSFIEGFFASLAAAAAWFIMDWCARSLWKIEKISQIITFQFSPLQKYISVLSISIILGVSSLLISGNIWFLLVFFALGATVIPLRWFSRFSRVGLFRVDPRVESGIDYSRALRLSKNSIDFMGTGAFKLTSTAEFEAAIARCNRQDRPIRFLLSHPESRALIRAAAQARDAHDTYRHRVEQSLNKLAELAVHRHMNIEVRFYTIDPSHDAPENFRIMIIDDAVCLFSYNIYGRGEGRDLPQIMFRNNQHSDNTKLFYICFQQYYEKMWTSSTPWNPKTYLPAGLRGR
jgi:hypothetical protein